MHLLFGLLGATYGRVSGLVFFTFILFSVFLSLVTPLIPAFFFVSVLVFFALYSSFFLFLSLRCGKSYCWNCGRDFETAHYNVNEAGVRTWVGCKEQAELEAVTVEEEKAGSEEW